LLLLLAGIVGLSLGRRSASAAREHATYGMTDGGSDGNATKEQYC
jgi:hypothetical protein